MTKSGSRTYKSDLPCVACGAEPEGGATLHHIKTRGSGGTDEDFNLISLCQIHHNEVHSSGLNSFSKKYKNVKAWLVEHHWYQCELTSKWTHANKGEPNGDNKESDKEAC